MPLHGSVDHDTVFAVFLDWVASATNSVAAPLPQGKTYAAEVMYYSNLSSPPMVVDALGPCGSALLGIA